MVCKMKLNDSFWKHFELDLQEIKLAYLNWASEAALPMMAQP